MSTPTPWTNGSAELHIEAGNIMRGRRLVANCIGYSSNAGGEDSLQENQANAELIVRAVNAHEALLTAAKDLLQALDWRGNRIELTAEEIDAIEHKWPTEMLWERDTREALRTAIALAEGTV